MTEPRTSLPTPAPDGAPAPAPKRSAVPAAPPEKRTTEIDKQRVPMAAKPYRLLALVKQDAVVRVQKEPDDTVLTWPHLLSIELFAAAMISLFLLFMGVFINAPLEELANGNVTPVVAKAPWYFVGLQELLAYFHPTVAGVLAPDRHPGGRRAGAVHRPGPPWRRRLPAAERPQDGRDAVHHRVRRRPRHHLPGRVLPRPRVRLDPAVAGPVLRAVVRWGTGRSPVPRSRRR